MIRLSWAHGAAAALLMMTACASSPKPAPEAAPEPAPEAERPAPPEAPAEEAGGMSGEIPAHITAALAADDRSEEDKAMDAGRHPAELMTYYDVQPGMKAAELFAGPGYTAEVLARVVGPEGTVYGVNSPFVLERWAEAPWAARVAKPVNSNIVRLDREWGSPFPEDVNDLDRVFSILVYHDFVWQGTDMAKHNKAIFDALKPGGIYALVDHNAADGRGLEDTKTLHRIEQATARTQVEAAGFVYVGEADFLRNESDTRDWNAAPRAAGERRGTSDRFVMTFVKPQ